MKKIITSFCILMFSLSFFACEATTDYMFKSDKPAAMKLSSQKSRVIFIRPGRWGKNAAPAIIDQNGKYLGESLHNSYFISEFNPGNYIFTAWWAKTNSIKATLKAGKTYYVKVYVIPGGREGQFNLFPVKKGSPEWKAKEKWMTDNPYYIPDLAGGQKMLDKTGKSSINSMIEKGKKSFDEYSDKEKARRSLLPEDGE